MPSWATKARISSTRHIAIPLYLMGFGKRPDLTPEYQVALLTGIIPGINALPLVAFRPMMSQIRT